jgi:hypothetical protein
MKQRCLNPNDPAYFKYGGRGIKMYKPWQEDYFVFEKWILDNLGPRPEGMSLDRIDNDGNYEPGNVRWADFKTQAFNRRPQGLSSEIVDKLRAQLIGLGMEPCV